VSTYSESYWKRREEADEERERSPLALLDKRGEVESATNATTTAAPAVVDDTPQLWDNEIGEPVPSLAGKPEFGPVEPPPPVPPDVAPAPPGPLDADFAPYAPSQPEAPAGDDNKTQRLEAIRRIRELGETSLEAPAGLRNEDLAAAARRDRQAVQRANLSETIRAAFARQAPRLQQEPSESEALMQQRRMADLRAGSDLGRKMTAEARIAQALRGGNGDDPSLIERRKALTEEARRRDETNRLRLEALTERDKRKGGLDERKMAEMERHNLALEAKWKKGGGAHPVTKVKAGEIDTVPQQFREVVRAIAEGRAEAPKPGSRFGADLLKYVVAYKPDFDATRYGAYKKVVEQQAAGKDVVAIDVAREHLGTAKSLIPKNASPQFVNRVKQAIASGTGDPEFAPFIAAATVAAHELAKVYGIEDQAGKAMVEHQMSAAQSPEQLAAVFTTFEELIAGKQRGLERQLAAKAPTGSATPPTAPHGEAAPAGKVTPSGKPYAKKQVHPATKRVRYLDASGAVIEESDG
jgi:hypothetical protein